MYFSPFFKRLSALLFGLIFFCSSLLFAQAPVFHVQSGAAIAPVANHNANKKTVNDAPSNVLLPPKIDYQTPQTYIINKPITALVPTNTGGAIPAAPYGQVTTVAGNGKLGGYFNTVTGVTVDAAGNVFVEDWANNQIKKITPAGVLTVFAGSGSAGNADGQGTAASFNQPDGIVADANGNLYIGDQTNHEIRKITPGGLVSTIAGNGTFGSANGTGAAATFYDPRGLAIDPAGNIYVADQGNNLIRKVTPAGVVTTFAGTGGFGFVDGPAASAVFNTPTGVGIDLAGNLYVSDGLNNAIRKITPAGIVSTFATGGGLNFPREIRADGVGNLYVSSQNSNLILKISPTGVVSTLAGTGQQSSMDGASNVATFNQPIGLALGVNGNLYVGDSGGNVVREISLAGYSIDRPLPAGLVFDPTTGIISGTPTALLLSTNYTITAYNVAGSSSKVINIQVLATLPKSVITLPPPTQYDIDASNILQTGATSNNTQTPITFTSSNPAVAYVGTDGQIHVIAPGTTTITFNQAGNENFLPADAVSAIYNIKEYQFIQFLPIPVKYICSADFSANAVSNTSVIPLTYSSSNTAVATVSSTGIIHITGLGTSIITVSQAGNDLYIAADPKTQIVTVNALAIPTILVSPDGYNTCDGTSLTYTATTTNAGNNPTYHWTLNGQASGTNANTYTSTTLKTNDLITCTVINNDGCMPVSSAVSNTVSLTSDPNVTYALSIAIVTPGPLYRGTPITFKATPSNNLQTAPVYQWYVNGQKVGSNSTTFTTATLLGGEVITCSMSAGGKCIVNPQVTSNVIMMVDLPVPVKIVPPNTFTPNGDGVNDDWQIAGLSAFNNSTVNVYNRYGTLIYKSIGYGIPWDGTYNKNALPVGTYYYIIDLKNGTQVLSGSVTIIR